jgi:type I site-specific restriction endonuclease
MECAYPNQRRSDFYQAISGTEEEKNIYKQFSPSFFDLVVVDECHRSSAAEDSAWREILEYFSSATQIGLTATPKETKACLLYTLFNLSFNLSW